MLRKLGGINYTQQNKHLLSIGSLSVLAKLHSLHYFKHRVVGRRGACLSDAKQRSFDFFLDDCYCPMFHKEFFTLFVDSLNSSNKDIF